MMQNILKYILCLGGMVLPQAYANNIDITGLNRDVEIMSSNSGKVDYRSEQGVVLENKNGVVYLRSTDSEGSHKGNHTQSFTHHGNIINMAIGENAVSEMNLPDGQLKDKGQADNTKVVIFVPEGSNITASQVKHNLTISVPVNTLSLSNILGDVLIESAKVATLNMDGTSAVKVNQVSDSLDATVNGVSELIIQHAALENLKLMAKNVASVKIQGTVNQVDVITHDMASVVLPNVSKEKIKRLEMRDMSSIQMTSK